MPDTPNALHAARLHAEESWQVFALTKSVPADTKPEWEQPTAEGGLLLSGRLVGSRPGWALDRFARDFHLRLAHPGDQRPYFDVSQPGRTVLAWRYGGVWVELWHPNTEADVSQPAPVAADPAPSEDDPASAVPEPVAATGARTERRRLLGPGGRLFFTRKSRTLTPKETTSP